MASSIRRQVAGALSGRLLALSAAGHEDQAHWEDLNSRVISGTPGQGHLCLATPALPFHRQPHLQAARAGIGAVPHWFNQVRGSLVARRAGNVKPNRTKCRGIIRRCSQPWQSGSGSPVAPGAGKSVRLHVVSSILFSILGSFAAIPVVLPAEAGFGRDPEEPAAAHPARMQWHSLGGGTDRVAASVSSAVTRAERQISPATLFCHDALLPPSSAGSRSASWQISAAPPQLRGLPRVPVVG